MKLLFLLLLSFNCLSLELKNGDILLQPLHCRLCNLIEAQTDSIYSHVAIVIDAKQNLVAEAFQNVRKLSLEDFLSKTQKRQQVKVVRPRFSIESLKDVFESKYEGLNYDSEFRWLNFDELGEKIYCSELVFKLLSPLTSNIPYPAPMKYDVNTELWAKHFKGKIPFGEPGISPAMFDDENFFDTVGFL